ncbi:hypothetical protein FDP41_001098 [Naegleria fowleri]|uniref:Thioredoxin domain-containing protein n=1 Tax=Naegleria fowleri TaxID=5763 RepID=A0A6A5C357_NAEFO|nr:uncharacterized protein FDP41_001098 [Naegleria fowleri]KAF0979945.1 hypothetical protein FDP41_001098 [Naegleria fowleri]CAG4708955.1 unnamed protein product [Naegleria fowleri]
MTVTEIHSAQQFSQTVLQESKLVVVDYFATWCPPCKASKPFFHKLSNSDAYRNDVVFCSVDVDELNEVAAQQGITAMPTFKVYQDGKVISTIVGADLYQVESLLMSKLGKSSRVLTDEDHKQMRGSPLKNVIMLLVLFGILWLGVRWVFGLFK